MNRPRRRHTRCTDGWFAKPPRLAKDVNTDEENELERLEGRLLPAAGGNVEEVHAVGISNYVGISISSSITR